MFVTNKNNQDLRTEFQENPLLTVDFPVQAGTLISSLHGYSLYSALKIREPWLIESPWTQICSIPGFLMKDKTIQTHENSRFKLRVPIHQAARLYNLAGERLSVGQGEIVLGIPDIYPMRPKRKLKARLVVIHPKNRDLMVEGCLPPDQFLIAAQRQLDLLEIDGKISIALRQGRLDRKVFKFHHNKIAGYGIEIHDLNDEDSILLQQASLGGKKKMGGGWFE